MARRTAAELSAALLAALGATDYRKQALPRLAYLGLVDTCGRCGGNGRFGPQSVEHGACFACGGKGKVATKITEALVADVERRVADGALAPYFAEIEARTAAAQKIAPIVREIEQILAPVAAAYETAYQASIKTASRIHEARMSVQSASNAVLFGEESLTGEPGARRALDMVKRGKVAGDAVFYALAYVKALRDEARAVAAASAVVSLAFGC